MSSEISGGRAHGGSALLPGARPDSTSASSGGAGPMPHFIEREGMVRDRLERRHRRRSARRIRPRRPLRLFKLQAERRITGRTRFTARAITAEPGGKLVPPGGILNLSIAGPERPAPEQPAATARINCIRFRTRQRPTTHSPTRLQDSTAPRQWEGAPTGNGKLLHTTDNS